MRKLIIISSLAMCLSLVGHSAQSAGTLKVKTPNGGEGWNTGTRYTIKWDKGDAGSNVKIELLKGKKVSLTIKKTTKNDGTHRWKIPSSVKTSKSYKIQITSTTKKTISDKSNKRFTITKKSSKTKKTKTKKTKTKKTKTKKTKTKKTKSTGKLKLKTSVWSGSNGYIPAKYTCDGGNGSPPLTISGIPDGTKSLTLRFYDLDVSWEHWLLYNIPPTVSSIRSGSTAGGSQGRNSFGPNEYGGPCPPGRHDYQFKLYALSKKLSFGKGATKREIEDAMTGYILKTTTLNGQYMGK